jgi:hypothetical protein
MSRHPLQDVVEVCLESIRACGQHTEGQRAADCLLAGAVLRLRSGTFLVPPLLCIAPGPGSWAYHQVRELGALALSPDVFWV